MKIDALRQFGVFLYVPQDTERMAERFPDCGDHRIVIDFSGCTIDYPATSRIIDAAIKQLQRVAPPRDLEVVYNIDYNELELLRAFVFGSVALALDGGKPSNEEMKQKAVEGFKKHGVAFRVRIVDSDTKQELNLYPYGC